MYTYSFQNRKRDLQDVFAMVVKDEPRFISSFRCVTSRDTGSRYEWDEDHLQGRGITVLDRTSGTLVVTGEDAAKVEVGTLLREKHFPALFVVRSITETEGAAYVEIGIAARNGSGLTGEKLNSMSRGDTGKKLEFDIICTPTANVLMKDNQMRTQVRTQWNARQVFFKEIRVPGSDMGEGFSVDNLVNRQTAFALAELARDMNRCAIYGRRVEGNELGEAGGLYYFAAEKAIREVDAKGQLYKNSLLNAALEQVLADGAVPEMVICHPAQAGILFSKNKSRVDCLRSDFRRGACVVVLKNELSEVCLTVTVDPDFPDSDIWVIDPSGFRIVFPAGGHLEDVEVPSDYFDGIRRLATARVTFEFRNVRQRCCRIRNLGVPER